MPDMEKLIIIGSGPAGWTAADGTAPVSTSEPDTQWSILRAYVDRFVAKVEPGVSLRFMQSSGGLTDAHLFQGKDAILSGPAGGIVGAVETAGQAGFERIIFAAQPYGDCPPKSLLFIASWSRRPSR